MKGKKAFIVVSLIPESSLQDDKKVLEEIMGWLVENQGFIPWVKKVEAIRVSKDENRKEARRYPKNAETTKQNTKQTR